jgi:hypothetical protein
LNGQIEASARSTEAGARAKKSVDEVTALSFARAHFVNNAAILPLQLKAAQLEAAKAVDEVRDR